MAKETKTADKIVFAFLNDDTVLNKETQQIIRCFWCHQWTLSQALHPRKHKTFVYHLCNVQHCINVIQMFCVYWVTGLQRDAVGGGVK